MDAWEADPLVLYRSLFPVAGIYGFNQSAGSIYTDTRKVDWDAQYKVYLINSLLLYYILYTITNFKNPLLLCLYAYI
jgi:hypothetical protein